MIADRIEELEAANGVLEDKLVMLTALTNRDLRALERRVETATARYEAAEKLLAFP